MYHYVSLLILLIVQLTFSLVTSHFFGCKVPGGDLSIERGFLGQTCTAHRFAY